MGLLSPRLRNYKRTDSYTHNFSCPICGDSKKNRRRARGYVYPKNGGLNFHCHNCGVTSRFSRFLRDVDPELYAEYKMERLADSPRPARVEPVVDVESFRMAAPVFSGVHAEGLERLAELPADHPCRLYAASRMIPEARIRELYHAPAFFQWAESVKPGKYRQGGRDEPRLVIPFLGPKRELLGYQARALQGDGPKYLYISLTDDPLIYGQERLSQGDVIALEGPIDAMFLDNAVASGGGDITVDMGRLEKNRVVIAYDNEPRSEHTVKKMLKAAKKGFRVCVWPPGWGEKDVNDMVRAGKTAEVIHRTIIERASKGMRAEMAIREWRRCG